MSVYYCESCLTGENKYIDGGNLPIELPGQPNVGFNIGSGFNGVIRSTQIQSDGKILVGGGFNEYNGTSVGSSLIRLESDGTIDTTFDVGTGFLYDFGFGEIYSIQIQSDGKILVGGFFDEYNGTLFGSGLIRLELDGTIDTTFDVGSGFYNTLYDFLGYINSIQIQSDGNILVGGFFDEYNGTSVGSGLIRLESDGTIDTSFDVGTGFYSTSDDQIGNIYSIQIQSDGKILVGGYFDEYNGTSVGSNLIRLELDGTIDTTFDVGTGFNNEVLTIVLQSDGKILAGSYFDEYSGTSVGSSLIRLESDGTIDITFDVVSGFNGEVYAIALQSDGKILVGGNFDEYNGTSVGYGLIRLESDGTIDTTFDVGTGFNSDVYSITLQSDGNILAGGFFSEYNGYSSNKICQINKNPLNKTILYATDFRCYEPSRTITPFADLQFNIGSAFNGNVYSAIRQPDGKILVGGDFGSYSGVSRSRIIRLNIDGSVDTSFVIGSGFNNSVITITLQSDGKILVGGSFTSYSGVSRNYIIRLNTNGSVDTSFVIGTGFNFGIIIRDIQLQSDGKILVGGNFISYSGVSRNNIIRLNTDGSIDTSFVIGTGFFGSVLSIELQPDGKIIAGGFFTSYSGVSKNRIIGLNPNGSIDETYDVGYGFGGYVKTLKLKSDGKLLVGGDFTSYGEYNAGQINLEFSSPSIDVPYTSIVDSNNDLFVGYSAGVKKLGSDGEELLNIDTNNDVRSIETLSDDNILVGGDFTTYSGSVANGLVKIDISGNTDAGFNVFDGAVGGSVLTTKELSDGKILVGGNFTSFGGLNQVDQFFFGSGFVGGINTAVEQPDGKIIVGGQFTSYSGVSINRIIRLNTDGSVDNSFVIGTGFNGIVFSIQLQSDNKILVGGLFTSYSGVYSNSIIRLNTDGSVDTSFVIGTGFNGNVSSIQLQSDGKILVGGDFSSYSGVSANNIIALNGDGSIDNNYNFGEGFNDYVNNINIQSNGKILVGGSFTQFSGGSTFNSSFSASPITTPVYSLLKDSSDNLFVGFGNGVRKMSDTGATLVNVTTNNNVLSLEELSDSNLLVGGGFTTYSGSPNFGLVKVDTNGNKINSFNANNGPNLGNIYSIKELSDGKILVGGDFASFGGNIIDLTFSVGNGFNGNVSTVQLQPDGKILVGGDFTSYSGVTRNRIIRLNTDGSIDTSFVIGSGFNSVVNTIQLQPDGKILVGGYLTSYSGVSRNYIIRLNTDGSVDTSFVIGVGFDNAPNTIQLQSDGKILVGGYFNSYSGISRNRIIRLNTNGSIDTSFDVGGGFNNFLQTIQLQPDGKILVGGSFTIYSGVSINCIIRLNSDGSIDTSFIVGSGFNSSVSTIQLQPDGKILAGGSSTSYSGVSINYIIGLNTDGSIDNSFVVGTGFDSSVITTQLQPDGKILVGGNFASYSGVSYNRIIRLNTDGSIDTSFVIGTGFNSSVYSIQLQSDGKILAGGLFTTIDGASQNRLTLLNNSGFTSGNSSRYSRLNSDGSLDIAFSAGTGFTGTVRKIDTQSDNKIIVAGNITNYNGQRINRIVRLNTDNTRDVSFDNTKIFDNIVNDFEILPDGKILVVGEFNRLINNGEFNWGIYSTQTQPDGKTLVGGGFTSYSGVPYNKIIRLNTDSSIDNSFVIGTGFTTNGNVYTIQLQPDGKILVGGFFTSYSGVSRNYIIRLNTDGSIDTSFVIGTGFNGEVRTIELQSDGKILVGGNFTSYSGISRSRIIRLNTDGSIDSGFVIGTGFSDFVITIELQSDGKILAGGAFTFYSGVSRSRIIRLNTNGSVDTSFVIGTGFSNIGTVWDIKLQIDGKILAVGNFTSYSGVSSPRIIRLNTDGSVDTSFVVGTGFSDFVRSMQLQSDGKILVGGEFGSYSGVSRFRIIRLNTDGSIDTSFVIGSGFNGGGVQTIQLQSDGNILAGGFFSSYNGSTSFYLSSLTPNGLLNPDFSGYPTDGIARLNNNGTLDTTFDSVSGFSESATSVEVQSDGKILVGGNFTSYSGIPANRFVRLNSGGTYDNSFYLGNGFNNSVSAMTIVSNQIVLVGGNFTSYDVNPTTRVCELRLDVGTPIPLNRFAVLNSDGSADLTANLGTGFNDIVNTIEIQPDGKILVGGYFTSYSGISSSRIIRITSGYTNDDTFNIGAGFNNIVSTTKLRSDNKILVGGQFTSYSGFTASGAILLNSDGSVEPSFTAGVGTNPGGPITVFIPKNDYTYTYGTYFSYNGVSQGNASKLNYSGLSSSSVNRYNRINSDGSNDTTFSAGTGFNSTVNKINTQTDNKIIVVGSFTSYSGVSTSYITRLNSDNTIDTSFDTSLRFNNSINDFEIQTDGKIVVGGTFTSFGPTSVGFNATTNSSVIQPDGKVIIGGSFSTYNGVSYNYIVRANSNGSIDTSFVIGSGFNGFVREIQLQPDGKILVGGQFTSYSGVTRNRIIRLNTDGSIDTSFVIGTGFGGTVLSIQLQPDGKILVGGEFSSYSGVSSSRIIRLNTDGSFDNSFVVGTGFNNNVNTIQLRPDGKILVGGAFTSYSGVTRNRIIRLNTDGSVDTSFVIGTGFGSTVRAIQLQPDGKILVGGDFTSYNGVSRNRLVRLNTDGSIDTTLPSIIGPSGVLSIQIRNDGNIIIGGSATISVNRFFILNSNGVVIFQAPSGFGSTINNISSSGNTAYITGLFTTYNGVSQNRILKFNLSTFVPDDFINFSRNRIARLNSNGTLDESFTIGFGFNGEVTDVSIQNDGKIIVGGNYSNFNGSIVNDIVRLNTGGTIDSSFVVGSGFNGTVNTLTQISNQFLFVGGNFSTYNNSNVGTMCELHLIVSTGITLNHFGVLNSDGSLDTSVDLGTGFNDIVNTIELQPDGKILVGGNFTTYSGVNSNRFIRLNDDYTNDSSLELGTEFNNNVNTIQLQPDGKILVGGEFTTFDGQLFNRIVLLLNEPFVAEYQAILLFDDCETCNGYIIPISANTEYIDCLFCNGDALLVDAPHPVWTGLNGGAVTQLDAVTIGGNGWNS